MSVSQSIRTNVDFLEDLANYLTLQLVQHGGSPLPTDESVSLDDLKKALKTIEKSLRENKNESPLPIKTVPNNK